MLATWVLLLWKVGNRMGAPHFGHAREGERCLRRKRRRWHDAGLARQFGGRAVCVGRDTLLVIVYKSGVGRVHWRLGRLLMRGRSRWRWPRASPSHWSDCRWTRPGGEASTERRM